MSRTFNIILILSVLSLFNSHALYAQGISVSGTVKDRMGGTIPGVTIVEKGTANGTFSDPDGNYTISVTGPSPVLVYSFVGLKTLEVEVGQNRTIDVVLEEDVVGMDAVVVVGYGTQKRGNVTGAVASVDTEAIRGRPIINIEEALQGQVTGLSISSTGGQPGAATKMSIRGITSVSGSSQPLIVIDGFPINEVSTSGGGGLENFSAQMSSFSFINPDDIESIEVLKDASATAIYGNRGANGVIMITTKKGRIGESGITYSTYFGVQEMKDRIDMLSFEDYVTLQQTQNTTNRLFTAADGTLYQFPDAEMMNVNWQDVIFRRGMTQNHSLAMQGKTDKTSYSFSASYNHNKSILIETDFRKLTSRLSLDHQFNSNIMLGGSFTYSNIINNGVPTDGREGTAAGIVISSLVHKPFRLDNNTQARFRRAGVPQVYLDSYLQNDKSSPENIAENTDLDKNINRYIGNFYSDFQLTDWLSFRTTVGLDFYNLKNNSFYSKNTPSGALNNGLGISASINSVNVVNENYFTFSENFGKHGVNAVGGISFQKYNSEYIRSEARDFKNEILGYYSLQGGSQFYLTSSADELFMMSYLARVNYAYDERFLATLSYRRDGTSRFINKKWGNFYSGAVAWNIKNESFLKESDFVSAMKLRASIGQTGNANVPVQGALIDQTYSNYSFNGVVSSGASPQNLENRDLSWETTQQINTGIDVGLLNGALNITADYFKTNTTDLLLLTPVSIATGFASGWFNIGELENSGIELSIDYALDTKSGFAWNTRLNVSNGSNLIKALGADGEPIYIDVNFDAINTDEVILQVGGSINDLFGYQTDGIYLPSDFNADGSIKEGVPNAGAGEQPGDIKYKDLNNDGTINGFDRTVIGNTLPDVYGSWSNKFSYKGVELDVVLQYSYGNDVFNASNTRISSFPGGSPNQTANWLDRWTSENPNSTQYARVPSLRPADYLIEDGSFIRIQTLRLGYNLPARFASFLYMKNARIYVAANNLAIFTKYSGYDPEVTSNQVDYRYPFVQGFDYGGFPRATTYMVGIDIQL